MGARPKLPTGADVDAEAGHWTNFCDQFMHISHSQSRRVMTSKQPAAHRRRARSVESSRDCRSAHLAGQMKNTFEFSVKGFKGNTRGDYIHEPFVTLHDVLSQTSDNVSISIELSMDVQYARKLILLTHESSRISDAFRSLP